MSDKKGNILVIDDNEDILTSINLLLKQQFNSVETLADPSKIPTTLRKKSYDVILLDMNYTKSVSSGEEGFHWLNVILEYDPLAVVIFITAYGDVDLAVKAVKSGATDFILKPWKNEKLVATITTATQLRKAKLDADRYKESRKQLGETLDRPFHDLIGESESMKTVFATIQKVAETDANVLILGENGTGKELVARAIHRQSTRADEIFLSVDLGSITETLFESELFGHIKGSYTDARENRAGRFETATGGTLFLDEIGNLSLPLQSKLLTAIEKGEISRVGSDRLIPVDVRHVCATNMPLYEMVEDGNFRQDLLYRINTVEISLPPLRERAEDIARLADHFLTSIRRKYKKQVFGFTDAAMQKMLQYSWPGNVRELQHAIERAIILSDSETLHPSDFVFAKKESASITETFDSHNIDEVEKKLIQKVLRLHEGNISQAAKELGITRASLYRRLEKYGL